MTRWLFGVVIPAALLWAAGSGSTSAAAGQVKAKSSGESTEATSSAASQVATIPAQPSLGDLARKVRAEHANQKPPARVYTNSDLPNQGSLSVVGSPTGEPQTVERVQPGENPSESEQHAEGEQHDGKWFATQVAETEGRLNMHQRELTVLQQKFNLAKTLFYPNPSQQLQQQHNMSDLNNLRKAIEDKQQQVNGDQQALDALRIELKRQGGPPGWLSAGRAAAEKGQTFPAAPVVTPGKHTKEYWQKAFGEDRERLDLAKEQEGLAEDEIELLKKRQAAELSSGAQDEIATKLAAAAGSFQTAQNRVSKAEADLTSLKQQFDESGAPPDWIDTDWTGKE